MLARVFAGFAIAALALAAGPGCRASPGSLPPEAAKLLLGNAPESSARASEAAPGFRLRVLHEATPLRGANGLACHAHRLYVAEALFDRISEVHGDGTVLRVSTPPDLRGPDDLVFDDAGNLYVTGAASGDVWRRSEAGEWRQIAQGLRGVNAIALDRARGRLFVSECYSGDGLFEVSTDGQIAPRTIVTGVGGPNSMAYLPDGSLTAPLFFNGTVARFDVENGKSQVLATGLRSPTAVKAAPDGGLLVLEGATGAIHRLPAKPGDGGPVEAGEIFSRLPPGLDNLAFCDETLVVSSFLTGALYAFKPWSGPSRVLVKGGLAAPTGLAISREGDVLATDGISIKRIRNGAAEVLAATVLDPLPPPVGLAMGADGAAYVTSPASGAVYRVDIARRSVSQVASNLEWPTSILALPDGGLAVTETGAGRVTLVERGAAPRVLVSGLSTPIGLARRGASWIVAEPSGGRVVALREGAAPAVIASGLSEPSAVAVALGGQVYVAERGTGALTRIENDGSRIIVARGLDLSRRSGVFPLPVPLVATSDGAVIVAPSGDGSVLRIDAP
jgi:sugar lactone lactonase YvrE